MRVNSSNNQTYFGWNIKTHQAITEEVLRKFPLLHTRANLRVLRRTVALPDIDELGTLGNYHFYFPDAKRSFSDKDGKNNAYTRYRRHVKKMIAAYKKGKPEKMLKQAGRALHFLQDMSQPMHTQGDAFAEKVKDYQVHVDFENFVGKRIKDFFLRAHSSHAHKKGYKKLFVGVSNISSDFTLPTKANKESSWEDLGQQGMSLAMSSTVAFLQKVEKLYKKIS